MIVSHERKMLKINNKMGWNKDAKNPTDEVEDQNLRYTNIVMKNILVLDQNLNRLNDLKKTFEKQSDKKQEEVTQKQIKRYQTENKAKLENCNNLLKGMKKNLSDDSEVKDFTLHRMAKMRLAALQAKNYQIIKKSSKLEMEIKEITKIKLYKWVSLMDKTVEFEEIDDYMKDPSKMADLMQNFYGGKSQKLDNALKDMEERVREMREIDEGIKKLVELIEQLGDVIKGNSEVLDSIDANMEDVKNYVKEGNDNLEEGKKEMESAGNKFCCLFVVFLIGSLFLVNYLMKSAGF